MKKWVHERRRRERETRGLCASYCPPPPTQTRISPARDGRRTQKDQTKIDYGATSGGRGTLASRVSGNGSRFCHNSILREASILTAYFDSTYCTGWDYQGPALRNGQYRHRLGARSALLSRLPADHDADAHRESRGIASAKRRHCTMHYRMADMTGPSVKRARTGEFEGVGEPKDVQDSQRLRGQQQARAGMTRLYS